MGDAWGGYSNGKIPQKAMTKIQNDWFKPDVAVQLKGAIAELAAKGIKLHINEGYRPLGKPTDQYVKDYRRTSTGGSNQWFQYGRMKRGETPTAAYPGGSIHGWAKAADVSPGNDNAAVRSIFARHGFKFDIASESWHAHFVGVPKPIAEPNALQKRNWKLMQKYLRQWGYTGAIDGKPKQGTWMAIQKWLKTRHGYVGAIDGIPGPMTYAVLKRAGSTLK